VDAALLARAHADGLAVFHVAHGIGLGVFEGDERHRHIQLRALRQGLVRGDDIAEQRGRDPVIVSPLLKGDAEHVLVLQGGGDVGGVDLHDVVGALFLGFEDFERRRGVARRDDAVRDLVLEIEGGGLVARVGEGRPVAVGAQAVGAPGPDIGAGDGGERRVFVHEVQGLFQLRKRRPHGGARRGDVLEGRGGGQARGLFELPHQLPGIEGVHEIDIAGPPVQNLHGQLAPVVDKNAGRFLIGVAAVFEFKPIHAPSSFSDFC